MLRFANKLRSAGRLLELVVIPGSKHASVFVSHFLQITAFVEFKKKWRFSIILLSRWDDARV